MGVWVKKNADGSIDIYKARLVAKGFHQVQGFDFHETFSPVVKPVTIRLIITLAITNHWDLFQLDVNNAFLHGILEETVYMIQPPWFEQSNTSLVCRLSKTLYGICSKQVWSLFVCLQVKLSHYISSSLRWWHCHHWKLISVSAAAYIKTQFQFLAQATWQVGLIFWVLKSGLWKTIL